MNTFSLHPHHIQLSFSEKNELIVYSAILMDKLIIPINNLHYFYVFQSNSESVGVGVATNHFNFSLRFHSEEVDLDKQYNWIELNNIIDTKYIYSIKSNMVFTTNIDKYFFNQKANLSRSSRSTR